jgi:hypothetical protein
MRRALLTMVFGCLVLGGLATPAGAESGSLADPARDAPARIDITRLDVDNDRRRFSMRIKVRNLRQKGVFDFFYERGRREFGDRPHRGTLIIVHRVDGETRARFLGCSSEDCSDEPGEDCPRMRVSWSSAKDVIRVAAPQKCIWWLQRHPDLEPPLTGTFSVDATMGRGDDYSADYTDLLVVDRG